MSNIFNSNNFAVQVIAAGSFADKPSYSDKTYLVETVTVRLNPIALNAYILSRACEDKECFESEEAWNDHVSKKLADRKNFTELLAKEIGFECSNAFDELNVKQIVSEVFAVAWIHEILN